MANKSNSDRKAYSASKAIPPAGNDLATAFWESFLASGDYDPSTGDAYKQFDGWIEGYIERELRTQDERHARERLQNVLAAKQQAALERRIQQNPVRWVAENKINQAELTVLAAPGRTSREFAVEVATADNGIVSLFAGFLVVPQRGHHFYLHVYALPGRPEPETVRVLLPTVAFETGSRWVNVPAGSVVVAG